MTTNSTPIRILSSMATRQLLTGLAAQFERTSTHRVTLESVGGVDAARRVEAGEAFDLVVLASNAIDRLIAAGHLAADSRVDLVRSGVAVAVPAGAMQPDIGTEAAVRQAVLAARSIGVSTGPSGVALLQLFERWGIAAQIEQRIVQAPPGVPVGSMLAQGRVDLGFQQLSELLGVADITLLGPLPPAIQIETTFSAARSRLLPTMPATDAVQALLDFMRSPEAREAQAASGMSPA